MLFTVRLNFSSSNLRSRDSTRRIAKLIVLHLRTFSAGNSSSGIVRWAHFGNRSVSLEGLGGPSNLVVEAESLGELERKRVTDALSFLAPEQTGRVQFSSDHRTGAYTVPLLSSENLSCRRLADKAFVSRADLYALGVTLFTILTGSVPFTGSAVDVFQAIVTVPAPKVHEVRPDVPRVVSAIIGKVSSRRVSFFLEHES